MDPVEIGLIGLTAGVFGTGFGSLITVFFGQPSKALLSGILGFAAGIMLAVVFSDLLPEAFEIGGTWPSLAGLILGAVLIMLLDLILPHTHFFADKSEKGRFIKVGAILGIGIAMHNLPEGLAIGAGYMAATDVGLGLAIAISIQNIPEGMAMAAPMYLGGLGAMKVFFYAALAGLPMGIGAYLGAYLGAISPWVLALSLGFAAGAMLYVIFDEMIPGSQELAVGHSGTFGSVAGVIFGVLLLSLI